MLTGAGTPPPGMGGTETGGSETDGALIDGTGIGGTAMVGTVTAGRGIAASELGSGTGKPAATDGAPRAEAIEAADKITAAVMAATQAAVVDLWAARGRRTMNRQLSRADDAR